MGALTLRIGPFIPSGASHGYCSEKTVIGKCAWMEKVHAREFPLVVFVSGYDTITSCTASEG